MKLKVQHVMDATLVVSQIIREARPMPQKGKYRLARMHAKLLPEFTTINDRRDAMIKEYDTLETEPVTDGATGEVSHVPKANAQWMVPPDKMPEFNEAWKVVGDQEIDVDVEPLPLSQLDLGNGTDGAIEARELITLGELVTD